jgi:hypothetical protein
MISKRLPGPHYLLQQWQQVFYVTYLLFVNQDVGLVERRFHRFRIRNEIRRGESPVELHALDQLEHGLCRFRLFHCNGAFGPNPFNGVCHHVPDS